jgi:hypothetical protein
MFTLPRFATLLLLLTAAAVQQVRYVSRAVLPAQDVVDTVSVAQRIEREGFAATVRAEPVSPLFPTLVAGMHSLLSSVGAIDEHDWVRPPQVVAGLALVVAVIPIFLTAEREAGRGAAVVASTFFIFLPALARLGADGLGDAVHLCLTAWAAWLIGMQRWTVAGLCIAAALLVRAEAAVIPLTLLLLAVVRSEFRRPSFFLATAFCLAPFLAVGVTSPGEVMTRLRGGAAPSEDLPLNAFAATTSSPTQERELRLSTDLMFGHKDRTRSTRFHGFAATLRDFVDELAMAAGYVLPLLVVIGGMQHRRDGGSKYGAFVTLAVTLQGAVLFAMAWRNGYLSTRHFAVPVMLTLPYAAMGLATIARWLALRSARLELRSSGYWQIGFVTIFVIASLVATTRPLNDTNAAHRQAADWLATAEPGRVLDQQGFTALTSGRTTYRFDAAREALVDEHLRWVFVERGDLEAASPRGESLRLVFGTASLAAQTFAAPGGRAERDVLVFKDDGRQIVYRERNRAR